MLDTSPAQLRKWDESGELRPSRRTRGGTRYYAVADLLAKGAGGGDDDDVTVCYAWVSGLGQAGELERQREALEAHSALKGWVARVVLDDGEGPPLRVLVDLLVYRRAERVLILDGLDMPPLGAAWLVALCGAEGIELLAVAPEAETGVEPEPEERVQVDPVPRVAAALELESVAATWQPSLMG